MNFLIILPFTKANATKANAKVDANDHEGCFYALVLRAAARLLPADARTVLLKITLLIINFKYPGKIFGTHVVALHHPIDAAHLRVDLQQYVERRLIRRIRATL